MSATKKIKVGESYETKSGKRAKVIRISSRVVVYVVEGEQRTAGVSTFFRNLAD